jgi:hypothetical protein
VSGGCYQNGSENKYFRQSVQCPPR